MTTEKRRMILQRLDIDPSWSLFLDRDGVINRRLPGDYVRNWDQFEWLPGVTAALAVFDHVFRRIVVVSNQQGVGKGLMTVEEVKEIHREMIRAAAMAGGRIDAVFFAPQLSTSGSIMRKPGIGMGLKARRLFPDIRFSKSVMVGDSLSDMRFGKRLGMTTVLIAPEPHTARQFPWLIDCFFPYLLTLSHYLSTE